MPRTLADHPFKPGERIRCIHPAYGLKRGETYSVAVRGYNPALDEFTVSLAGIKFEHILAERFEQFE